LEEGKIYPEERVEAALNHFFKTSNLEKLRELTLRELASQIDLRRRELSEDQNGAAQDQVMVCLSSRGPNSGKLLRYASRLAGKLNRNWYAVYVQTQSEEATVIDARTQSLVSDTLTLAKQLGAMVFTYKGEDIADTILRFAKEYRVGHIVIGRPGYKPLWKRFGKNRDIVMRLIENARGTTIIVLDTRPEEPLPTRASPEPPEVAVPAAPSQEPAAPPLEPLLLTRLLSSSRIVMWDQPARKEVVLKALVEAVGKDSDMGAPEALFREVMKREEQGSTFFNEGVAFPHVRIDRLAVPAVAVGLTKRGVEDVNTEKPIEIVFLILSSAQTPDAQVQILGLSSRAVQSRYLLQNLRSSRTPEQAMKAICDWETGNEACVTNSIS
jgi:two-component system sensor histidine kinase KdpD